MKNDFIYYLKSITVENLTYYIVFFSVAGISCRTLLVQLAELWSHDELYVPVCDRNNVHDRHTAGRSPVHHCQVCAAGWYYCWRSSARPAELRWSRRHVSATGGHQRHLRPLTPSDQRQLSASAGTKHYVPFLFRYLNITTTGRRDEFLDFGTGRSGISKGSVNVDTGCDKILKNCLSLDF